MDPLLEAVGWFGAGLLLAAYLAVSMGWLRPSRRFQTANLIGACAFIINGAFHGAWPSAITNIAWGLISLTALVRVPRNKDSPARDQLLAPSGPREALAELATTDEAGQSSALHHLNPSRILSKCPSPSAFENLK